MQREYNESRVNSGPNLAGATRRQHLMRAGGTQTYATTVQLDFTRLLDSAAARSTRPDSSRSLLTTGGAVTLPSDGAPARASAIVTSRTGFPAASIHAWHRYSGPK
jgi:hypothetical protein